MAVMKSKIAKTYQAKPVKAKESKMIKPPKPAVPRKPKSKPRTINSRTGALGATSPY
jgi:hypothetical protein